MADSTLDYTGEEPGKTGKGHGVGSLGPSDTSDSGSDIAGAPGLSDAPNIGLRRGTNEDPGSAGTNTAGPDVGDGNLSSDSDSGGTGERASAGRDPAETDRDIGVDRIIPADFDPGTADPREDVERFRNSGALADADAIGDDDAIGNRRATDDEKLEDEGLLDEDEDDEAL
ncbi:MAG: hypothetical protein ROZ64_04190 [Burkholderiaceae bacterium]|jgi:hypothetical protein|nr:hypothetical protein [Burkholderiaceae bacterium]